MLVEIEAGKKDVEGHMAEIAARVCLRCCLELKPRVCGDGKALPLQCKRWG